jgi:hypothetical protein
LRARGVDAVVVPEQETTLKRLIVIALVACAALGVPNVADAAQNVRCGPGGRGFHCTYRLTREDGVRAQRVYLYYNGQYRGYASLTSRRITGRQQVTTVCDGNSTDRWRPEMRLAVGPGWPIKRFYAYGGGRCESLDWGEILFTVHKFRVAWGGNTTQWFSG